MKMNTNMYKVNIYIIMWELYANQTQANTLYHSLFFFLSNSSFHIRIISQFFIGIQDFTDPGLPKIWLQSSLLCCRGFAFIGAWWFPCVRFRWSCCRVFLCKHIKITSAIILVGFWKSRRLLCVPPSLYCIHDKRLLLDIYITVLVICFWCTGMGHLLGVCYTFIQSRGWSHINYVVTGWEESVCCNTYQLVQVGQFSYCEI